MKAFLIAASAMIACVGAASADTRNLQGFTGVGAEGQFHVDVAVGDHFSVEVTGPDADKIDTHIEGNSLHISGKGWHFFGEPRFNARVHVVLPRLESIGAARGAEVDVAGVNADHIALNAAMGGEVHAAGSCQNLSAHAAMGGEIDAAALDCRNADVASAMGGDAHVSVSQSLSASAAMGGAVHVSGNPPQRSSREAMGGEVSFN
jgi:hypothetical protein